MHRYIIPSTQIAEPEFAEVDRQEMMTAKTRVSPAQSAPTVAVVQHVDGIL
jgi:hypothetical protein